MRSRRCLDTQVWVGEFRQNGATCAVGPTTRPEGPLTWGPQAGFCTTLFLAGLFQVLKVSFLLPYSSSELCPPPQKASPGQITSAFWQREPDTNKQKKTGLNKTTWVKWDMSFIWMALPYLNAPDHFALIHHRHHCPPAKVHIPPDLTSKEYINSLHIDINGSKNWHKSVTAPLPDGRKKCSIYTMRSNEWVQISGIKWYQQV